MPENTPSKPVTPPQSKPPRKSLLRRFLQAVLLLVLIFAVAIAGTVYLALSPPSWYAPPDPKAAESQGVKLENAVATQASLVRNDSNSTPTSLGHEWSVSISQADANDWLASRLADWSRSRDIKLPSNLQHPQVAFAPHRITIAGQVTLGGSTRVVAIDFSPRIAAAGELYSQLAGARLGRLPLPIESILQLDWEVGKEKVTPQNIHDILAGNRPLMQEPQVSLADGRRVQLLDISPTSGRLEIKCRTLPPR